MINKYFVFILVLLFIVVAMSSSNAETAGRTVRYGCFPADRFHEKNASGELGGYGYDYMERVSKAAGWKVEYVGFENSWEDHIQMLNEGKIDFLNDMYMTQERRNLYDFPAYPSGFSATAVACRKGDLRFMQKDYKTWNGIRVGGTTGDLTVNIFADFALTKEFSFKQLLYASESVELEHLKKGDVDLIVFDSSIYLPDLEILELLNPQPCYMAIAKGRSDLENELNRAVEKLNREDPHWMEELVHKWRQMRPVKIVIPQEHSTSENGFLNYSKVLLRKMSIVCAWEVNIVEAPYSEILAGKVSGDLFIGIPQAANTRKSFMFSKQIAGMRPLRLLAVKGDERFSRRKIENWPSKLRIACNLSKPGQEYLFKKFIERQPISYSTVHFQSHQEVQKALREKAIDLFISGAVEYELADAVPVECVATFDEQPFFMASRQKNGNMLAEADWCLEYLQVYETQFLNDLSSSFLNSEIYPENKTLRAGLYIEEGLSEFNSNGQLDGFDVVFIRKIAEMNGWHLVEIPTTYSNAQKYLAEGVIDIFGSAFKTPERELIYDYPEHELGPLYYSLKVHPMGRMKINHPETWQNAKIGVLRGSKAVQDLDAFMKSYNVSWSPVEYEDLSIAARDVRNARLDCVYTLVSDKTEDLPAIMIQPTQNTYFCTNKQKPWIKEGVDSASQALLRENPDFQYNLAEKYFPGHNMSSILSPKDIEYVKSRQGKPVIVDISKLSPLLKTYDFDAQKPTGFMKCCLDELTKITGLEFRVLPPVGALEARQRLLQGQTELRFGDISERLSNDETVLISNALPLSTARVARKDDVFKSFSVAAIPKENIESIEFYTKLGFKCVKYANFEKCLDAVSEGNADFTPTSYHLARYWIAEAHKYSGLDILPANSGQETLYLPVFLSTLADPELRTIMTKAFESISASTVNEFLNVTLHDLSNSGISVQQLCNILLIIGVAAFLFLMYLRSYNARKMRYEMELQKALDMAQTANRTKTVFLNNMSHDIRTPMNAIIGFTGLASSNLHNSEKVKDYLAKISQASKHLLSLINDVLDMSRIESGKMKLNEQSENLHEIIQSLHDIILADLDARQLNFQINGEADANAFIICDRLRLNQVLLNILSNSIKYTPAGGNITLDIARVDDCNEGEVKYRFTISDTGIGMSLEFLDEIYEPFTRVSSSTVSGIQGTGLGMAITKNIVEMMNGTIEINSQENQGTQVRLVFTFKAGTSKIVAENNNETYDFSGKKVLLVEDNELNREIAEELLTGNGFIVDTAENGLCAVNAVKKKGITFYDYILMDIQMPVLDGYAATAEIRAMPGGDKALIIALSANAFVEDHQKSRQMGMNAHVSKPLRFNELLSTMQQLKNNSLI